MTAARRVVLSLALLLAAGRARAGEDAWEWRAQDTVLELGFVAANTADWLQTQAFVRHGWGPEVNPFLGERPSAARLALYEVSVMAGHAAVARLLPRPWRTAWQAVWIGFEVSMVCRNAATGYGGFRMELPW